MKATAIKRYVRMSGVVIAYKEWNGCTYGIACSPIAYTEEGNPVYVSDKVLQGVALKDWGKLDTSTMLFV